MGGQSAGSKLTEYATWIQNRGIDHFIYCAEKQVDTTITNSYFTTRSPDPTDQRESATEPSGWSVNRIRMSWLRNLYDEPAP